MVALGFLTREWGGENWHAIEIFFTGFSWAGDLAGPQGYNSGISYITHNLKKGAMDNRPQ